MKTLLSRSKRVGYLSMFRCAILSILFTFFLQDGVFCQSDDPFIVTAISTATSQADGCGFDDGTISVTIVDGASCPGTTYSITMTPVANSSPLGNTPLVTVPNLVFGATAAGGPYLFVNAGSGDYSISVMETGPCDPATNPVIIMQTVQEGPSCQFSVSATSTATLQAEVCGVSDGTISVTITEGSCVATLYDIVITPVANSSPLGNTPPFTVPSVIFNATSAGSPYLITSAGVGDYTIQVFEIGSCNPPTNPVTIMETVQEGPSCQFSVSATSTAASQAEVCGVSDGTISVTITEGSCVGTLYDIVITPVANSSPLGNTPPFTVPSVIFNATSAGSPYLITSAGVGDYTIQVFEIGSCNPPTNPVTIMETVQEGPSCQFSVSATSTAASQAEVCGVSDGTISVTITEGSCVGTLYDIVITPVANSSPLGNTPPFTVPSVIFNATSAGSPYLLSFAGVGDYTVQVFEIGSCNPPTNPVSIVQTVQEGPSCQFTVSTVFSPNSQAEGCGGMPDGSIAVSINEGSCPGTIYDIRVTPVANSSPLGNTPPAPIPNAVFGATAAGSPYLFTSAGPGRYTIDVLETGPCNPPTNPVTISRILEEGPACQSPNCRDINVSVNAFGKAEFTLQDILTNATTGGSPTSVVVQNSYGGTVFSDPSVSATDPIEIDNACAKIGQIFKVIVSNSLGTCWSSVTLKKGGVPTLKGRSKNVYCFDSLVIGGHISGVPPTVPLPCEGEADASFVADWVIPYECMLGNDTTKIILREYELLDKRGKRISVYDTIVVWRLPPMMDVNTWCIPSDTTYCGVGNKLGPFMIVPDICPEDGETECDTICFLNPDGTARVFHSKCGIQVHVDKKEFSSNSCENVTKYLVEVKQDCYGMRQALPCPGVAPPDLINPLQIQGQIGVDPLYFQCETWRIDLDTTPPLFAPKILGEFTCLTVDTSFIGGSDFGILDIFQPVAFTNDHDCEAYSYLPPLCVFEDWSGVKFAKATVEGGGTYILENEGERCYLLEFGDDGELITLEDFVLLFGGELPQLLNDSIIDLLDSLGLLNQGYCYRSHEKVKLLKSDNPTRIFYEVYDSCHLIGRDTAYIHVKDHSQPVAVADKGVTVSISDKEIWVDASEFDEGSWDNCGVNMILARRSDWTEAGVDLCNNSKDGYCDSDTLESALCWLWTDGHDTLWTLNLEDDKHCNEIEAHYQKQLDWLCKDETPCGRLIYNSWLYDMIKYATMTCKYNGSLDDRGFDQLFYRAVGNPQEGDMVRIKNEDFLNFIDTALGGIIRDSFLMGKDIIELDTSSGLFSLSYGVDIFKCPEFNSVFCGDFAEDGEELFVLVLFQLLFDNCFPFFGPGGPDFDLFIPSIFPHSFKQDLFTEWSQIGGGWSDAVPFSCEDACGPVTVEILVMDYWCNWSTAWTTVWVEDKTPLNVVKDVVEQEVITCKVYKEDNYSYPGEQHPVSIQYIVEQAKTGQQDAFDALDGIFGGYCKAWIDPYGNYVDSNGLEIECDIPFYDSICDCKDTTINIRVYDEHLGYLWIDSTVKECYYYADTLNFQKGIVAVNCADNVYCEQEVWCDFDHCGQGYIFRKFKIWQGCPEGSYAGMPDSLKHPVDTIYRHQRIWVGNECELDKYMFDVPYDTEVLNCAIEYGPDGNVIGAAGPENTGYATYKFDDDCRIVGIAHEDKVFKVVGGDAPCYKILRTWYFADWCAYGGDVPNGKWWLDDKIVLDKCVQKIIVIDTVPPVCVITGPVISGDSVALGACDYDLVVTVDALDACGLTSYYWQLTDITDPENHSIFDDSGGDLDGDVEDNFDISSEGLYPGTFKLKVQIQDECTNESYCEYVITVTSAKKPTPVCITSLTARLTPWDSDADGEVDTAHAVVWAYEYDRSSTPACDDDSLEYRLEFLDGTEDDETPAGDLDFLEVGCADIGTRLVRLWVISHPSGSRDYCDAVLVVQSDFSGCTTQGTGEQVMVNSTEKATSTESGGDKIMSKGDKSAIISGDVFGAGLQSSAGFDLEQNQPNPFQVSTQIGFTLPETMDAQIEVFDVTGRMIKSIAGSFVKGHNQVELQINDLGQTGILYYRLQAGTYLATKRMILID